MSNINIGNRIFTELRRTPPEVIEKFRDIPSSNIGDIMNRMFCMNGEIKAMTRLPVLGPAFTVRVPEGDNVLLHCALELAQAGDIIVVDGAACVTRALMGEMMFTYAQARGIGGFVLDGAIRDVDALKSLNMPVYARAVTPQGPLKNGLGEINVPIACGGQVVMPGDIIAGDCDGICVIPRQDAEMVYAAAREKFEHEQQTLKKYCDGQIDFDKHAKQYEKFAHRLNICFDCR